eukprot:7983212-Lingulodinium_polyedra.AAC.1
MAPQRPGGRWRLCRCLGHESYSRAARGLGAPTTLRRSRPCAAPCRCRRQLRPLLRAERPRPTPVRA